MTATATPAPAATAPRGAAARSRELPSDLAAVLDPEQRQAAEIVSGPVLVVAGAGTGKTRTVTHRIAHAVRQGVIAPEHVLAVTFTARAAGELRERLTALGVRGASARTFHAAALRQLTYFWPRAVGGTAPALLDHKAPVVAEAAARVGAGTDRATVRDLSAEIEWAKVGLHTAADYPGVAARAGRGEVAGLDPARVARVIEAYEAAKASRGVIDFEDVLLLTTGMLERHEDVAAAVRGQYRWFTVDEYQDVSPAQHRLLQAWVGPRRDVCVVGDPNQTIYTFAGADAGLLDAFSRSFPDTAVVRLTRNYRSRPGVIAAGNTVLGASAAALVAARPAADGPAATPVEPAVTATGHDDDDAEAAAVAREVADVVAAGVPVDSVAVLVRTNAQLEVLEGALASRGVPYVVRGGERFFSRREVREAVTLLRGAAKAGAPAVDRGSSGPAGGLAAEVRAVLSALGWREEAPGGPGAVRQRWESLAAIVSHAERFASEHEADRQQASADDVTWEDLVAGAGAGGDSAPDAESRAAAVPGLAAFVADLDARAATQHAPRAGGVTLATLHSAKGLEWDAVFLTGLNEGTLPISMADTEAQVAEERRLFYVGITRARELLRLSWSRSRTTGGRGNRRPSRFLDGIRPPDPVAARPRQGEEDGRRRGSARPATCRSCGAALSSAAQRTAGRCEGCPPRYDPELFEALRRWRSAEAVAAKVPSYVVFSDATLEAIAEGVPRSTADLARVNGVGAVKLEKYGEQVLALVSGTAATQ